MTRDLVLRHAETDADVVACFGVIRQLRPNLQSSEDLLARLALQRAQGYRLLAVWDDRTAVALAGYRRMDNLIHGRFIYVDDLVTDANGRGRGHGERLLSELRALGCSDNCNRIVLDTGLANALAQRFYFRCGLLATGLHFGMELQ